MSIKGVDLVLSDLSEWQKVISGAKKLKPIEVSHAERGTNAKQQIAERGSLVDRLAQTSEEAESIYRAEQARNGEATNEDASLTDDELAKIDEDVVMRLVDDMIDRTILKGK